MDFQKLMSLLKIEEGPKLDFKERLEIGTESGKKEIAKDVIAIANSQGGRGYLLIGIQDKTKKVIGIDPKDYKEETIQQIISLRVDPPLVIRAETIQVHEKYVCVLTIFRSFKKTQQMRQNGAFYVRRGSTTDIATRDEIASMLQYNGIINNEQIPLFNIDLSVFSEALIEDYLHKISLGGEVQNLPLLNNLGIIHYDRDSDEYYPTVGGVLMFSKNPQMYLPHTGIKVVNKITEKTEVRFIKGDIDTMVNEFENYIKSIPLQYPYEALEECIINAIIHRDYFDNNREILVLLSKNKVVISNPGAIFGNDTVEKISREENPRRRNNWLYHVYLICDVKKRLLRVGTGLAFVKQKFHNKERVRYINIRKDNLFKVVLPGFIEFNIKGEHNGQ